MEPFLKAYRGRRVFVTGHSGFKGSWLCEWLLSWGAEVWGYSLAPATRPSLFNQLGLARRLNHIQGDLRDASAVCRAVKAARPDYVFHLAAQPIVHTAHAHPADTWSTNVMGTVNLLEALRTLERPCAAVVVTTDKVYGHSSGIHTEHDPIGANDPYGASKAAVELAVGAWRESFFPVRRIGPRGFPVVALATARSGNVIGGGDWAPGRLLPDCVRALMAGTLIDVRNPAAIRPWQHVLDPLAGYLMLGSQLKEALSLRSASRLAELSGSFNFGPKMGDHRPVRELVAEVLRHWPGKWRRAASNHPEETAVLRLNSGKARRILGWKPRWRFTEAVDRTVKWYRESPSPRGALELTRRQLAEYAEG